MRKLVIVFLLLFINVVKADEQLDALNELHKHTQISYQELKQYMSNCDASQQSMYFCAWKDYIIARNRLHTLIDKKKILLNGCAGELQSKVDDWEKPLYRYCRKLSIQAWGEGSMQPTDQMVCMSSATEAYNKKIDAINDCSQLEKL